MNWVPEEVFDQLLRNSIGGGLLVALFLLGMILSRGRLGPKWGAAIALLIFIRLVLPATPEIGPKFPSWEEAVEVAPVQKSDPAPVRAVESIEKFAPLTSVEMEWLQGLPSPVRMREDAPVVPAALPELAPVKSTPLPPLSLLWLVGALVLALLIVCGHVRLAARVRRKARLTDPLFQEIVAECCQSLRIFRPVSVLVLPGLSSASLFGIWRPRLLLPKECESGFSREELRAIFLHELAHLRRGDLWWNWLGCLVLCLHWFNPMVWLLVRRFRADREQLCDRLAIENLSDSGIYSATLMKLLRDFSNGSSSVSLQPGMASFFTRKSEIKQRIVMIHQTTRNSFISKTLILATIVALGWMTFPSVADDEERRDSDRPRPEREEARDGDRDRPREGDLRGDGDRENPERKARGDGDREQPERQARGDGDRDQPERQVGRRDGDRDGDRDVPPERRDPNVTGRAPEMHVRMREHAAQMEKMHKALADARRTGREEEARAIEARIHEAQAQMQRTMAAGRGDPQPNPRGEAQGRIQHLRLAAENLERAGLHDESRRYREQAEEIQRDLERSRGNHGPEGERTEHLQREIHELHEVVGDLRRKVQELEEKLREARR